MLSKIHGTFAQNIHLIEKLRKDRFKEKTHGMDVSKSPDPFQIKCRCGKVYSIPPTPITESSTALCDCGRVIYHELTPTSKHPKA